MDLAKKQIYQQLRGKLLLSVVAKKQAEQQG